MLKHIALCTALLSLSAMSVAHADERSLHPPIQALQAEISEWLSVTFGLPSDPTLPHVVLVPPAKMVSLRYRGLVPPTADGSGSTASLQARDTVAIYDDGAKTIYLPEGWTGVSPAEQSVLVHEMVHFLQAQAQQKFECPQEREQLAYRAQGQWLSRTGRSLESEFEVDPFSLLVRTRCIM